jgi:hypothetical protein
VPWGVSESFPLHELNLSRNGTWGKVGLFQKKLAKPGNFDTLNGDSPTAILVFIGFSSSLRISYLNFVCFGILVMPIDGSDQDTAF